MRQLACAVLLLAACKEDGRGGGPLDLAGCVGIGCNIAACGGTNQQDTTVVGTVFAPNGVDPVPNATVYVPTGALTPFANAVSCDLCGTPPNAVTSTLTRFDGGFVLPHVPAGSNIPVVVELGRFRRVVTMNVTACQPNVVPKDAPSFGIRLPGKNADLSPDDRIPKIAVATGDFDQIECVLKRMGIQQVDLYDDRYKGTLPATQGSFFDLLADRTTLETYNLVIINCTDAGFEPKLTPTVLGNLEHYVGAGGRIYATDWAYDFINQVPAFSPYLCFVPGGVDGPAPPATCDASPMVKGTAHSNTPWSTGAVPVDDTLRKWLGVFPGTLVSGQVPVQYNFVVINQVGPPANYPTKVWLEGVAAGEGSLPQLSKGKRPMTVTFDYKQCGRVHYSTYNTEPNAAPPDDTTTRYPSCGNRSTFNPQERLLEYLIFETAQCVGTIG